MAGVASQTECYVALPSSSVAFADYDTLFELWLSLAQLAHSRLYASRAASISRALASAAAFLARSCTSATLLATASKSTPSRLAASFFNSFVNKKRRKSI